MKSIFKLFAFAILAFMGGALAVGLYHGIAPQDSLSLDLKYVDFISITLTALGLMITILGFFVAAAGVIGWASTRLSQQGGGGTIPSRIDVPRPASWQIFRADPSSDQGFVALAEEVVSHEAFPLVPDCWGRLQIESTTGPGVGITGVKMNTSARINMHMTIKSGATNTLDADEQPYED